jgi:hypothetical protein
MAKACAAVSIVCPANGLSIIGAPGTADASAAGSSRATVSVASAPAAPE